MRDESSIAVLLAPGQSCQVAPGQSCQAAGDRRARTVAGSRPGAERLVTENQRLLREVRSRADECARLRGALREARQQRRAFAQVLHDSVTQDVSASVLLMHSIRQQSEALARLAGEHAHALQTTLAALEQARDGLRKLVAESV